MHPRHPNAPVQAPIAPRRHRALNSTQASPGTCPARQTRAGSSRPRPRRTWWTRTRFGMRLRHYFRLRVLQQTRTWEGEEARRNSRGVRGSAGARFRATRSAARRASSRGASRRRNWWFRGQRPPQNCPSSRASARSCPATLTAKTARACPRTSKSPPRRGPRWPARGPTLPCNFRSFQICATRAARLRARAPVSVSRFCRTSRRKTPGMTRTRPPCSRRPSRLGFACVCVSFVHLVSPCVPSRASTKSTSGPRSP
mmetsp:Transcript_2210/g.7662  ORF Transcript_2210/g.7662 Transcript_2210/m.7662 type:complete len:256 (-) Transcript_2210:206-973(-)